MLETNKKLKMEDIEKNLDGNLCRCTGYRPIVEAFKTLTTDCSEVLQKKCGDIEDCASCPIRKQNGQGCGGKMGKSQVSAGQAVKLEMTTGEQWVTAKTVQYALAEAGAVDTEFVRFVAGNTSTGIFKNEGGFKKFIDINGIPELKAVSVRENEIVFGGGVTLTQLINLLKENQDKKGFEYGQRVAEHLERVANISVRNVRFKKYGKCVAN